MKKIEAIIRPEKFEAIKAALGRFGIHGMTVTKVAGCGMQKGRKGIYRGTEYEVNLIPKLKIEIVTRDKWVEDIVQIIINNGRTGEVGDGKIFVYPIDDAVQIRTGRSGEDAI